MFYCETEGEKGQLWFNEIKYISEGKFFERDWPEDINVSFHLLNGTIQDGVRITTINVTIPAKSKYNNTLVRCSDEGSLTSKAYLTIQGNHNILHTAT